MGLYKLIFRTIYQQIIVKMRGSIQPKTVFLVLFLTVTGAVLGTEERNDCVSEEELIKMKEDMARKVLQSQLHYWQNVTIHNRRDQRSSSCDTAEDIKESLRDTNRRLDSINETLSQLKMCGHCTVGNICNPADNCSHILSQHPGLSSGYYWIQSSPGYVVKVYCDMERVCGCGEGGGWMRVADIDMTRHNQICPVGLAKVTTSGKTMCGGRLASLSTTTFSTHGIQYSRVCGRIIGYQYGNPDAFGPYHHTRGSIDSGFVDGIVLTHGSPRQHIWTFAASPNQYGTADYGCPCIGSAYRGSVPPYVGNDYFCDSGNNQNVGSEAIYFTDHPLWDGQGCVTGSCCSFNNPPWFCKTLTTPTTDDIELRIFRTDNPYTTENLFFKVAELYIR